MKGNLVICLCVCLSTMGWISETSAAAMNPMVERQADVKTTCPSDAVDIVLICNELISEDQWCENAPAYTKCLRRYKRKCSGRHSNTLNAAIQRIKKLIASECD